MAWGFNAPVGLLEAASEKIGREISPHVLTPGELKKRIADKSHCPLRYQRICADRSAMEKRLGVSWRVKKNGAGICVLNADSSLVAEVPQDNGGDDAVRRAYVLAAAPQLLDVCTQLKSLLENNLLVTSEGFRINCSDVRAQLLEVILRATGCRKSPEEP